MTSCGAWAAHAVELTEPNNDCANHTKLSHMPVTCAVMSEPLLEAEKESHEPDLQSVANPRFLEGLCTAITAGAFGGSLFAALIFRM